MTKEQEEAIDRIKYNDIAKPLYCGDITICNIDDLKTVLSMLEEQEKTIDLMSEKLEGLLVLTAEDNYLMLKNKEEVKQYFENKAKES